MNQTRTSPRNEEAPTTGIVRAPETKSSGDSATPILAPLSLLVSPDTKLSRVFEALLNGKSFHRFEAERELRDHTLHSTVSEIQKSYGVTVSRQWETVPGFQGKPTRVKRYWIEPEEIEAFNERLRAAAIARGGEVDE